MKDDEQRVMAGADLERAALEKSHSVAAGNCKLAKPLQRDQRQYDRCGSHAVCRRATQLAVKPGPSAVSSDRRGKSFASARSSTNSTVGADMLP